MQVEIPLADSLSDAEAVVAAQKKSGLVAMVGHTRRFNPSHQFVRQRILEGEFHIQQMDVQTFFFRRTNMNALGQPRSWTDHLLWHHAAHTVDLFAYQCRSPIVKANALQGPIHPTLGIAMDMSIQLKAENGAICTLSLSFNNEGPLGTFFRYIGDTATYIARYDDLFTGKDEKIDVSKVDVSMNGIELQDREFFAAIREGREPNASVAQVLPCYRVLDELEKRWGEPTRSDQLVAVIARSETTKQSSDTERPTIPGLLRFARNDGALNFERSRSALERDRSPQLGGELLDLLARLFELLERRRVGDAEVRALAEGGSVHDGDALRIQKLGDEILVVLDHLARRRFPADRARAGRIDIERAFRLRALQMLRLAEHRHDEIAPLLERLAAHGHEVLRPVQRLDRSPLRDRAGARGLLALHHVHGLDELGRPGGVADAPAGHGVGFRDAVHGQRARLQAPARSAPAS